MNYFENLDKANFSCVSFFEHYGFILETSYKYNMGRSV